MVHAAETVELTKRFTKDSGYLSLILPSRRKIVSALQGVSLNVAEGKALGFLGTNGAGKTTLLKILAGLVLPDEGRAFVHGYDVAKDAGEAREYVGYVVTEERSFYWRLTGKQNLDFFGKMNNIGSQERQTQIEELAERLDLTDALDTRVLYYSTGMRQKLAIARALLRRPRLLLMDEPTRSLDPVVTAEVRRFVKEELVERDGSTVIVATHDLDEARKMCDSIAIMHKGEVLASGSTSRLLGAPEFGHQMTVHVEGLKELATAGLNQIPGVHEVSPLRSVDGNGVSAFDILVDEPKVQVPMVLESLYRADGRVSQCGSAEASLGDVMARFLKGRS